MTSFNHNERRQSNEKKIYAAGAMFVRENTNGQITNEFRQRLGENMAREVLVYFNLRRSQEPLQALRGS